AFCPAHRPEQALEVSPDPGTLCLICMESVEDRNTYSTLVCPACKTAWFNRDCIQGQALCAGRSAFWCPQCRVYRKFVLEMSLMGIQIPMREPLWEHDHAFAELGERHSQCNASKCLYPGGREEAEEDGPRELLLCCSCAAVGTHRHRSSLGDSRTGWECDSC
ncbi:G2E3 ligase, partial [Pitta sordida]|nr:G2E3 ligase [Pitta sordida]